MEKTWYIIVDQKGEEIRSESEKEAKTAFECGGIVTNVREIQMILEDETLIVTRAYTDMKGD